MEVLESIFFSSLIILFPLFSYFLFATTERNLGERTNNILFDLALFTALYFMLKYDTSNIAIKMMFLTVPLLIAYLRDKRFLAVLLSLCIGIYYIYDIDISYTLVIVEFTIYFIFAYLLKQTKQSDITIISVFAILKITFIIFELYFITTDETEIVEQIIILPFAFYFTIHLLCYLMKASEKTMSLHMTIKELEHQKQLRDSLFKITHEIKNPIAVCKGYLDMIDMKNQDHIERYIPIIKQEIERTLMIMSDFMMLTKINVEKRSMDASVLLEDVCEISYFMLKERKINFSCAVIDEEVFIDGDYDRLKQVFINIIKNAMEAISKDKKGVIKLCTKLTSKCLIINITDNGIGMNEKTLSKIGEPFFTTKNGGTGLGVKFCKEIIEAHDGEITYKSKPNRGTLVIVSLPIKKSL